MTDADIPTPALQDLIRRRHPANNRHLNLRLSGADAVNFNFLKHHHSSLNDSFLIRGCVRIGAALIALKASGKPLMVEIEPGKPVDLVEAMGLFVPECPNELARPKKPRKKKEISP